MSVSWVRVADLPEAGPFAGRVGWVGGWSSLSGAPDAARGGDPVFGAHIGGSDKSDIVYSINFDDTGDTAWFSPHLLEGAPDPEDRSRLG
jgi:hypothetical protein